MKNKVILRITRRIISICVILSIIVTGIEPWQIVKASDAVHVYTLDELRTAIANNSDIILEADIKFSDYTFEYSEEHRRIGIYSKGNLKSTYDVDDNKYYEDYESDVTKENQAPESVGWGGNYSGTFDGNGRSISGVYSKRGLFSEVNGNIKNLNIKECFINGYKIYDDYTAILCHRFSGNIEGCTINNSYLVLGECSAGGFVNYFNGNMKNCVSDIHVFTNKTIKAGGLVQDGDFEGESNFENCRFIGTIEGTNSCAAGIVCGTYGKISISGCINNGNVTSCSAAGGIMCDSITYREYYNSIDNCINAGNVAVTGNDDNVWRVNCGAGGILAKSRYTTFNVQNCVNIGNVKGIYAVGGIVGAITVGNSIFNINTCSNIGTVQGIGNDTYSGGIAGAFIGESLSEYDLQYPRIYNSLNSGQVSADNSEYSGTILGYQNDSAWGKTGVENCVSIRKNDSEIDSNALFGKYISNNIKNCYDVLFDNDTINIIEKKSEFRENTRANEIVNIGVINNKDELIERLNLWVEENKSEDNIISFWEISDNNEIVQLSIDWEMINSLYIPEKNDEQIDPFIHVYTKDEMTNAINNNLNVMLEADIKYSDYTFEYNEECRRIGIYLSSELKAAYDVDDNKYYENYESETVTKCTFDVEEWSLGDYSGTLDGNGYAIYGICPSTGATGKSISKSLFTEIKGTVKNLKLRDCYMNGYNKSGDQVILCNALTGAIEGCKAENCFIVVDYKRETDTVSKQYGASFAIEFSGIMKDCESDAHIFANDSIYVGGLVCGSDKNDTYSSISNMIKVSGCTYSGVIEGKAELAAGIITYQPIFWTQCEYADCLFTGRISGEFENAAGITYKTEGRLAMNNCINKGDVEGCVLAAGILCQTGRYQESTSYLSDCTNEGSVKVKQVCDNHSNVSRIAGGIMTGYSIYAAGADAKLYIRRCINTGSVMGGNASGGIVGWLHGYDHETSIISCVNEGDVSALDEEGYAGGIIGIMQKCDYLYNNHNTGNIYGVEGRTGTIAGLLNWSNVKVENCVNTGTINDDSEHPKLFGKYESGDVQNCYDAAPSERVNIKAFNSEHTGNNSGVILETAEIDNYSDLCNRLNLWIREKSVTYEKEYLSTWVYLEDELTYGDVDWEDIESIPTATPTVTPTSEPALTVTPSPIPTLEPTASPTSTLKPTLSPSSEPTSEPALTVTPSPIPTLEPTASPTPTSYTDTEGRTHVYTLNELRTAVSENKDIVLEADIKFSEYTFEYSEEYRRIGIYNNRELQGAYDVDLKEFYEAYDSDKSIDISFESEEWDIPTYTGNLDGNGKTIYGMCPYLSKSGYWVTPYLAQTINGSVKNLTFKECFVYGHSGWIYNSALLCNHFQGTLDSCKVENTYIIAVNKPYNDIKPKAYAASFSASFYGNMNNCKSDAHFFVNDLDCVAGLVIAGNYYTRNQCEIYNDNITECEYTGTIEGTAEVVGGISVTDIDIGVLCKECVFSGVINSNVESAAGIFCKTLDEGGVVKIYRCTNEGDITVDNKGEDDNEEDNHTSSIGGIANQIVGSDVLLSCTNKGTILALGKRLYVGGIVGHLKANFNNFCNNYNIANISGKDGQVGYLVGCTEYCNIKNCVNSGLINGNSKKLSFAGYHDDATTIINCYDVEKTDNDDMKTILYPIGNGVITETIDNYKELCNRLNIWVRDNTATYGSENLSTWIYSEDELKFGEVDVEYLNSLPVNKPTSTPIVSPSPKPFETAKATPKVEVTSAPMPDDKGNNQGDNSYQITTPPQSVSSSNSIAQPSAELANNIPAIHQKPVLKSYIRAGKKVILKWNKNTSFAGYNIYRSAKKKGKYMPLKNSVKTGTYTDTKVKANETWYYKIRGCIIINGKKQYGAWSESVKAAVGMRKPEITLKKEVTPSGEKYVRMRVKKCDGQYIQVYVRTKQKRYNLVRMPNSDWRKMKSTFNFRYSVGGKKMYFRIRSYGTYNNKLIYSLYSDSEGIKL